MTRAELEARIVLMGGTREKSHLGDTKYVSPLHKSALKSTILMRKRPPRLIIHIWTRNTSKLNTRPFAKHHLATSIHQEAWDFIEEHING